MMWTTSRRSRQLSTADRAGPSGGKRRPRLSTPCCDQRRLALRRPVETEQYASNPYREVLERHGVRQSMSRRGNCLDNAPMESFFASLKKEHVNQARSRTREEAKAAVFEYVEIFYNRQRLHSALGYRTPVETRLRMEAMAMRAA